MNKKNQFDVSVIIPAYNAENTIIKCLNSVLNQNFNNIEIIVIDDGSTDNTVKIVKDFFGDNIVLIEQKNHGVSYARNVGIDNSHGNYIFFLDSDDYIDNNVINSMFQFANKYNLDLVSCNHIEENSTLYAGNKNDYPSFIANTQEDISKHFFHIFPKSACAKLFKKNVIVNNNINFPVEMQLGEDLYFTYNYILHAKSIGKVDNCYYRVENVNPHSLSKTYVQNYSKDLEKQVILLEQLFEKYPLLNTEYHKTNLDYRILNVGYFSNNLFKINCPYGFFDKTHLVKNFINNHKEWIPKKIERNNRPKNFYEKILCFIIKSKNSVLICLFFLLKEKVKEDKLERSNMNE